MLKQYARELSGLTKQQALVALSTKNLTSKPIEQVLSQMGLIASEDIIQAELLQTTLAKQAEILDSLDMFNMNTKTEKIYIFSIQNYNIYNHLNFSQ